jgi:hypothetical protein
MKKSGLLLGFLALFFTACETDFEVNAPWQENSIVYALLEANTDTQYVKIYKAYLGEGDALLMAQEPDSIYYAKGSIRPYLLRIYNGAVNDTIWLKDTVMGMMEEGVFAHQPNRLYYTTKRMYDNSQYQFRIDEIDVSSHTYLVEDALVDAKNPLLNNDLNFVSSNPTPENPYSTSTFRWNKLDNAYAYDLKFRFIYDEYENQTAGAYLGKDSVEWRLIYSTIDDALEYAMFGEQFYAGLGSRIEKKPSIKRKFDKIKLVYTVGAQELHDYFEYSKPNESLLLEKPKYDGNVEGGYGVFSSRIQHTVLRGLNAKSKNTLITDPYTEELNFY